MSDARPPRGVRPGDCTGCPACRCPRWRGWWASPASRRSCTTGRMSPAGPGRGGSPSPPAAAASSPGLGRPCGPADPPRRLAGRPGDFFPAGLGLGRPEIRLRVVPPAPAPTVRRSLRAPVPRPGGGAPRPDHRCPRGRLRFPDPPVVAGRPSTDRRGSAVTFNPTPPVCPCGGGPIVDRQDSLSTSGPADQVSPSGRARAWARPASSTPRAGSGPTWSPRRRP